MKKAIFIQILIVATVCIIMGTTSCDELRHREDYVIVPKSIVTCSCEDDSSRFEILHQFVEKKINMHQQNITINANKVKHNDFENSMQDEFSDFFPRRTVYYVVKRDMIDQVLISKEFGFDETSYYCKKEEAFEAVQFLNTRQTH